MSVGSANQTALTYLPTALSGGNQNLGNKIADPLNIFGWQKNNIQIPYSTGPATQASGVGLNPTLTDVLGGIGSTQQGNIGSTYNNLRTQAKGNGATPAGIAPGSYADQRFTTGQNLANQNLKAGLGGVLGNEGYQSWKNQRDFNQNMALAKYTGALNKPSLLEQALGGLSGGAQVGGMVSAMRKPKSQGTYYQPTSDPNYGYYNSGGSGLNLYGN
jgi:hypothetical protein